MNSVNKGGGILDKTAIFIVTCRPTGPPSRSLENTGHIAAEQHATLTANQQNSTATQLRLVHKTNTQAGLGATQ